MQGLKILILGAGLLGYYISLGSKSAEHIEFIVTRYLFPAAVCLIAALTIGCSHLKMDYAKGGKTKVFGQESYCNDLRVNILSEVGVRDLDEACSMAKNTKLVKSDRPHEACLTYRSNCQ